MQCETFEDRVNELLDERRSVSDDAALVEHATTCGTCRSTLDGYAALLTGLDAFDFQEPKTNFAEKVIAAVGSETDTANSSTSSASIQPFAPNQSVPDPQGLSWRYLLAGGIAVALCVGLTFGLVQNYWPLQNAGNVAAVDPAPIKRIDPIQNPSDRATQAGDGVSFFTALRQEAARFEGPDSILRLPDSLQPFADSVGVAISLFRKQPQDFERSRIVVPAVVLHVIT